MPPTATIASSANVNGSVLTNQGAVTAVDRPGPRDTGMDVAAFFARQKDMGDRYAGQGTDAFQQALVEHHRGVTAADCDFYHTVELPGDGLRQGDWDLRDYEDTYLGGVDITGKRVIEFGPASGFMSAAIAARAKLTVVDLPFGSGPEFVPHPDVDMAQVRVDAAGSVRRLRNSWWYARQRLGFQARAFYADIYRLPSDIGRHDVAFFGSILLHLSSPFRALEQAAAVTDEAIVVSDVDSSAGLPGHDAVSGEAGPLTLFNPTEPPFGMTHWWALSPGLVAHMLRRLGFGDITITRHVPPRMASRPAMFTVVGRRAAAGPDRRALPAAPANGHAAPDASVMPDRGTLPVPPPALRFAVSGTEDEGVFLGLGRRAFDAIGTTLAKAGEDRATLGRVLDFGCGVGRVLRHWAEVPSVAVEGTDLSADAIAWDRENLPFARFGVNGLAARLSFEGGRFGLVYALSVFTHLPRAMQMPWFVELDRIVRPGGLAYITTHGPRYRGLLTPPQAAEFDGGDVVVTGDQQPGSNHCAAFHPEAWMRQAAATLRWAVLAYEPCGARGNPDQDSWLFRKGL